MPEISGIIQNYLRGSIESIGSEPPVIESKTITENGTYTAPSGVDGYSPVEVAVPIPEPVIETKTITENGTYTAPEGVDGYSPVEVAVPIPEPVIESKTITENGTYTAPEGVDGYSPVEVNVPLPENAYLLKSVTTPTPIASFSDGEEMVMPTLKVAIEPQQDLHGYDAPWVGGAGKNKYEGSPLFDEYVDKNKWTLQAEKYNGHDVYKKSTAWGGMYKLTYLDVGTYTFSCMCKTSDSATIFIFLKIDNVTTAITDVTQINNATSTSWTKISGTFNVTSAGTVALRVERSNDNGDIYISEYQIESGSTPTSYAPYSNICPISGWSEANVTVADDVETPTVSNVYTIDLDGTRYGVDLDVINGIGREYKEYPSYNGETLIGPWISDRDAYAEGTTPTIGAQVVDKGDISTFNTIPTAVKSLRGVNNVWADTGDITDAEYFSKEV